MNKFLYNGVPFPQIPSVDGYKNVVIVLTVPEWDFYEVYLSKTPYVSYGNYLSNASSPMISEYNGVVPNAWSEPKLSDVVVALPVDILWTNHNIYEEDGVTLYMEKSPDPVPVPQLNPAALMQGFATMLSLRRNRT